jgi:hypothetical protein
MILHRDTRASLERDFVNFLRNAIKFIDRLRFAVLIIEDIMVSKICETKTRRTLHYPCRFLGRSAFSKRETNLRRSDREEHEPAAWICRRKQAQFHLEEKINRSFQGWKSFRNIQVLTVLNSGDGSAISCTNAKAAQKICKTRDSAARI